MASLRFLERMTNRETSLLKLQSLSELNETDDDEKYLSEAVKDSKKPTICFDDHDDDMLPQQQQDEQHLQSQLNLEKTKPFEYSVDHIGEDERLKEEL